MTGPVPRTSAQPRAPVTPLTPHTGFCGLPSSSVFFLFAFICFLLQVLCTSLALVQPSSRQVRGGLVTGGSLVGVLSEAFFFRSPGEVLFVLGFFLMSASASGLSGHPVGDDE